MEPIHKDLHDNHQFKIYGYKTYRNDTALFKSLKLSFEKYMEDKIRGIFRSTIKEFCLENYHNHLQEVNCDHHQFISSIGRRVDIKHLDMKYIRELIKIANKDFNKEFHIYDSKVEFRVVRPNMKTMIFTGITGFPYFTPLVNVYLPLASSYHDSALGIVPFSHEWSEEDVIPTFTYEESVAGKNI